MPKRATYTILSMMKDEGPFLLEWLAYHRHIGFDRICIYTNDCSDGTDAMLLRLEQLGEVAHFRNPVPEGKKPQPNAMKLAASNPAVIQTDWVIAMDADEFVSIKAGRGHMADLMERLPPETDAVAITWRFFGSAGHTDWNPGLVTQAYTRAAPDRFRKGWGVKTLFRPFPGMRFGIHRPRMKGARTQPAALAALQAQNWVNGSGQPMHPEFQVSGWRSTGTSLGYDLVEMNHYAVKSFEAYLLRGLRGNVNNKPDKYNAAYFALFDRNEVSAPNATRHTRAVERRIHSYLADPEIARLYKEALAFHATRVDQLRGSGAYAARINALKRAADTPIDRLDEVLFTQHLPREWQEHVARLRAQGVPDKQIALAVARATGAKREAARSALPHPPTRTVVRAERTGRTVRVLRETQAPAAEEEKS